jgi:hypothetical protein
MTFFFQIAFPEKHVWEGKVMVFFHCTSCRDFQQFYPSITYVRTQINIPDGYLDTYQTNCRIWVFDADESKVLRDDFAKRVKFERLEFERINPRPRYDDWTKVGGTPAWGVYRDVAKEDHELYKEITYMGGGVEFLMQIEPDWEFTRLPDAPLQILFAFSAKESTPYKLFGGPIKLFGTTSKQLEPPRVLIYFL